MAFGQEDAFQYFWAHHCPVVVTGVNARLQGRWTPDAFVETHGNEEASVDNSVMASPVTMSVARFFELFTADLRSQGRAVKMRDWPPSARFRDLFGPYFDAFMDAVPMPAYTRYDGYRNLAAHWPVEPGARRQSFKPDLGPKMYLASPDVEGVGSTPLHLDVTSAVNILVYVHGSHLDQPGALWHIFPATETAKLREYLREVLGGSLGDPIHARKTYINHSMREDLSRRGVRYYEIYQKLGDTIFIPAGCAHQVSNIQSCIKIACDFVCMEGIPASMTITQELRQERQDDILNVEAMLWHAWQSITPQAGASGQQVGAKSLTRRDVRRRNHVAHRRSQESAGHKHLSGADYARDYQCQVGLCATEPRRFLLDGLFNHL
ncbi:hypothetical protein BV20DRAFT_1040111 [Pilatotrama ljubarskyi]|nr:hypothetical protein BV20DRAFT_1040111 [Pilatotrama ljubarskyi]